MKKEKSMGYKISLFFLVLLASGLLAFFISPLLHKKELPVLGEPGHTVLPFILVDQAGDTVRDNRVDGKLRVASYFFATCKGICPVMNHQLQKVNETFGKDTDVVILSHTVDPGHDSVPVLRDYARTMGASAGKWYFFTGSKQMLYKLASKSYLLNTDSISDGHVDTSFFHTPNVTLIDKEGRIRGFYDATNKNEIEKLIGDIRRLQ